MHCRLAYEQNGKQGYLPDLVVCASSRVRMTWTQMARGGHPGHHRYGQYCCSKSTITMLSRSPSTAASNAAMDHAGVVTVIDSFATTVNALG